MSLGGDVREIELTQEIADIVGRVQQALGLEIGAVDLLYGEDGFRVCEVNLSAQFFRFEKATSINVAEAILRYCVADEPRSQAPVPVP